MDSILLTGPAAEPLSLDESKLFLRVEHNADDQLITALITAARLHIEAQVQAALITQNWRLTLDDWPCQGRILVRPGPLQAVIAARIFDMQGHAQAVDLQAFVTVQGASTLSFMSWALPVPGRAAAGVELDLKVGFADAANDVPQPLRQAIRLLVAHWYENRGLVASTGQMAVLPATVAALIAPYRMLAL